jgi:hypothetical protein
MKAHILDPLALRAITPTALVGYIRAEGWHRIDSYGAHSDVFALENVGELVIPGTDALADYADVVSSILERLSFFEGRDELQVYRDLVGADRDVIRVRAPDACDDGSVRVDSGVEIISQARNLLLAAACAAKDPRSSYRAGKIKDAADYMDRVRLGQTEQGSFVVTMLAPVPPALESADQLSLWPTISDEPFDRLVTRRLADGLQAARTAAEAAVRGEGVEAFERAVPKGVSANLCEALATLIDRGQGLDVSLTWAKTRPTPEPRRKIEFSVSEAPLFKEAARLFRSMEPRPDERLIAFVVRADRKPDEEVGHATLSAFLDGQPVSIRADLEDQSFSTAVTALDGKTPIAVTGDLRRRGQRWQLENVRDLMVLDSED